MRCKVFFRPSITNYLRTFRDEVGELVDNRTLVIDIKHPTVPGGQVFIDIPSRTVMVPVPEQEKAKK